MGEWEIVEEIPANNPNEWDVVEEIPIAQPGKSEPLSMERMGEDLGKRESGIAETWSAPSQETVGQSVSKIPSRALNTAGDVAGFVNDIAMQTGEAAYKKFVPEAWQQEIKDIGENVFRETPVSSGETVMQSLERAPGRAFATIGDAYRLAKEKFPEGMKNVESVANIAMATPVLRGIGKAAEVAGTAAKGTGKAVGDIASAFVPQKSPEAIDRALQSVVDKGINKGIRPTVSGKGNIGQVDAYRERSKTAVKEIVGNKDNLILTDAEGTPIKGMLPQNLQQFSEAIDQTKKGIFKQYDDLQRAAGETGAKVDLSSTTKELENIANETTLQDLNPEVVKYAQERIGAFTKRGAYTTTEAQDAITRLNKSLESFYRNPSYENATKAGVDAVIANNLRKTLDSVIEGATEGGYQELKNSYGALKTIEKEVAHRAVVDSRKNIKGLVDFTDIYTSGELVAGLATMNPGMILKGSVWKGVQQYIKAMNNPNRIIRNMFKEADDILNKGAKKRSYGPTGPEEGPPPRSWMDPEVLTPVRPARGNQRMLRAPYEEQLQLPAGQGFDYYDIPESAPFSAELAKDINRANIPALPPGQGFELPEGMPYPPVVSNTIRLPHINPKELISKSPSEWTPEEAEFVRSIGGVTQLTKYR